VGILLAIQVKSKEYISLLEMLHFVKGIACLIRNFSELHHTPEGAYGHNPNTSFKWIIEVE